MASKSKKKQKSKRARSMMKNSTVKGSIVRGSSSEQKATISGSVSGAKGDPLDFQISAKVKVPKGKTISAKVLTEAIRYRIRTGRSPRGIQLRIIRWRNPARKFTNPDWRYPDDPETIANSEKMGYGNVSPQQAAWVTLSAAVGAIQVSDFTLRSS